MLQDNVGQIFIRMIVDDPQSYITVVPFISKDMFSNESVRRVWGLISDYYGEHSEIPSRELLSDLIDESFKEGEDYETAESLLKPPDPRDAGGVRDKLLVELRKHKYGKLYDMEAIEAYNSGNYDHLDKIYDDAQKVGISKRTGLNFFADWNKIFEKDPAASRVTTGIQQLDYHINFNGSVGGPSKGETFLWMGPPGRGKSTLLVNCGVAAVKSGKNVLHVTMELSEVKVAAKYYCNFTGLSSTIINDQKSRDYGGQIIRSMMSSLGCEKRLRIEQYPPDEITTDTIHDYIEWLDKMERWRPDVVIVDYLELMRSRNSSRGDDDYSKQKNIATELRRLAAKENVVVFSAIQANRGAAVSEQIGMEGMAESYGKAMATDYICSLNQTMEERVDNLMRVRVVKNRNGSVFDVITVKVEFDKARVIEVLGER